MVLSLEQRLERVKVRLEELFFWREREVFPLADWTLNGAPIAVGAPWPSRDGVQKFATLVTGPTTWPLADTRLVLDLGGEALVSLVYGSGETIGFGNDPYHKEFQLKAHSFGIEAEAVARLPFGQPVRSPHLNTARLIWVDTAVQSLHLRLIQVAEAAQHLGAHEVVAHLIKAAEDAFYALDWPSGTQDYIARFANESGQQSIWQLPKLKDNPPGLTEDQRTSVMKADLGLIDALRALQKRYPPQGEIALTGHAHIDLAWLWPYAETRRKMRRTFSTAVSLMEGSNEYLAKSGFRFNQSTAHYYAQLEEDDPALFDKIKAKVKTGGKGVWGEIPMPPNPQVKAEDADKIVTWVMSLK